MRGIAAVAISISITVCTIAADDIKREGKGERRARKDALEGKPPPALHLADWVNTNHKPLTLDGLKGKVVVMKFWGAWCHQCEVTMAKDSKLYQKYQNKGLVLLGVHTSHQKQKMPEFVKEHSITWPVAVDQNNRTVKAFLVDSYPDYYVIDRAGNLRFADLSARELDRAVSMLLDEPGAPTNPNASD